MAAAQDMENPQMSLNSPGPSASQDTGTGPRIAESQGGLRVEVTVLRAHNIPHVKNLFGLKFFVTVSSQATKKKTSKVRAEGATVQWNENLGPLIVQPSSRLVLRLYADRFARRDTLIGRHEMIPVESQTEFPFVLTNSDRKADQSIEPVMLYLTAIVSPNSTSYPAFATNLRPTEVNDLPSGEATRPSMAQVSTNTTRSTVTAGSETLSPPTVHLPSDVSILPLAADRRAGMSSAENVLHDADEAITTINLSNTLEGALERIKWVMDALSSVAELHPYAKMAYGLLFAIPKTLLDQFQRDDNIRTLLVAIHDAFDFTNREDRFKTIERVPRQAQILTLMLQHVCHCCDFIQSYTKNSQLWKRILNNTGGQADKKIEDFRSTLLELHKAFLDEAIITTEITALQILDDVGIMSANVRIISADVGRTSSQLDGMATQLKWVSNQVSDTEIDAKIREIPYGTGSRFTPDKGCLAGTRTAFLDFIVNWVNDPISERCLVLFGQAGTGKSCIAHEIAHSFDKIHRLTSSFIFLRKEQSKREAYHLFTTIARDLSDRYPSFKTALGRLVKDNSSLRVGTRDYGTLFRNLILEPLKDLHIVGPILVVIDALDESGDATGRMGLPTFLAENLIRLPSNFRVLITSRPDDSIVPALVGAPSVGIRHMKDSELSAKTNDDILAFLRERLPSDEFTNHGEALAIKAEGLFQWAAVVSQLILDPPGSFGYSKKKVMRHLLKPSANRDGQNPLDDLYREVLEGYITGQEARLLFRAVAGQLLTAIEPLSIRSLTTLQRHADANADADADDGAVVILIRRLGSLLSNADSSDGNLPIVPLHTSFRDFLTNKDKSGEFCVGIRDAHRQLAHSCLGLLLKDLKFNICHLETSHLANKDVADLNSRVDEHIPPALLYACRFWGDHLEHIGFESDLFRKLRTFFEKKLLFWLEALSLTNYMGLASAACSALSVWLASGQSEVSQAELEEFKSFVIDASMFVRYFGGAMAKSAPHVYLSALPFVPTSSLVSAHYSSRFPRILRVERGRLSDWPSSELVISTVAGRVYAVAFSPDSQRIVSGSHDGTIRMWNATTGDAVAVPFTGHTDLVKSVAFSLDGQRVVSGSGDRTIRVWNATTGEIVAGPFTGHTGWVGSVAFSPDGHFIVSGSGDRTICVWNAITGETATGPFTGHSDAVWSVAFSPDGQRIVSSSEDRTIRVWNATTGETVAGPFTGHASWVLCVVFSPDGQRIVSGSRDCTIRVWDATTGESVAGPFSGHTSSVESVAFSPDGQRIASGSSDQTIRLWDASTGKASPFTGHTGLVMSVAFSPDGQRIVSGSYDQTVCVWNATPRESAAGPYTRHAGPVWSVTFSPDGQRVVSGSDDRTICVWNTTTGETVAGPFTGHTGWVWSVVFSSDGQRIVSGSADRTIRVWNAITGETVAGPLTGHMDVVRSVAFSPDGQRIVSSSEDRTIRVWNATTGETVAGPFTGHTDVVGSVTFSPDGQRIVSGSVDRTIRVWNAITGETVAGPFTGHVHTVRSVDFSPDGQRIVSGSADGTIRVWDATTGESVAGPFTEHTDQVESVAFSPDGQRIVSGSDDRTIRVWNATTGEVVGGPFTGHASWVWSVAFSPDGQLIVSGSEDRTIRVWNLGTATSPFTGHMDSVESVAFSPDDRPIISSERGSNRILNSTTGTTGTTTHSDFTDHTIINDEGWICGGNGELLVWIPLIHRAHLHRPSNLWVAGENETRIDLSTSVHGRSWTTCIDA